MIEHSERRVRRKKRSGKKRKRKGRKEGREERRDRSKEIGLLPAPYSSHECYALSTTLSPDKMTFFGVQASRMACDIATPYPLPSLMTSPKFPKVITNISYF
jgi:hypothetical protein